MSTKNGHNGHPVRPPTDQRDYLGEALLMGNGKTMMLPERGHIEALCQELVPLQRITALQNRALVALLLSVGQPGFVVDPKNLAKIEAKRLDISIEREMGGPILVKLIRPTPADPQ